tara:strand:+ start:198 stop:368 length:171 start_codon:yes stop_codon:yes gene_type:complete
MRSWSWKYVSWRLTTAYPGGFRYAAFHPLELTKDFWNYLTWCQKIDLYIKVDKQNV